MRIHPLGEGRGQADPAVKLPDGTEAIVDI